MRGKTVSCCAIYRLIWWEQFGLFLVKDQSGSDFETRAELQWESRTYELIAFKCALWLTPQLLYCISLAAALNAELFLTYRGESPVVGKISPFTVS